MTGTVTPTDPRVELFVYAFILASVLYLVGCGLAALWRRFK